MTARDAGLVACRRCARVWPRGTQACGRCGGRLRFGFGRGLLRRRDGATFRALVIRGLDALDREDIVQIVEPFLRFHLHNQANLRVRCRSVIVELAKSAGPRHSIAHSPRSLGWIATGFHQFFGLLSRFHDRHQKGLDAQIEYLLRDALRKGDGTEFILVAMDFDAEIPRHVFSKAALRK